MPVKTPVYKLFDTVMSSYKDYIKESRFYYFLVYNSNIENGRIIKMTPAKSVEYFLEQLKTADNKSKNEIENSLVQIGNDAVPGLVSKLSSVTGTVRGIVAMTLIRIGEPSVAYLKKAAAKDKNLEWVAKYLITEINGAAA